MFQKCLIEEQAESQTLDVHAIFYKGVKLKHKKLQLWVCQNILIYSWSLLEIKEMFIDFKQKK